MLFWIQKDSRAIKKRRDKSFRKNNPQNYESRKFSNKSKKIQKV